MRIIISANSGCTSSLAPGCPRYACYMRHACSPDGKKRKVQCRKAPPRRLLIHLVVRVERESPIRTCDGERLIDMHPSCPALYTEVPPVKCLGKNRSAIVNKFVIWKRGDVIGYCRGGSSRGYLVMFTGMSGTG